MDFAVFILKIWIQVVLRAGMFWRFAEVFFLLHFGQASG
jgi:hypothetical protein